jgi:hypothetical protein
VGTAPAENSVQQVTGRQAGRQTGRQAGRLNKSGSGPRSSAVPAYQSDDYRWASEGWADHTVDTAAGNTLCSVDTAAKIDDWADRTVDTAAEAEARCARAHTDD